MNETKQPVGDKLRMQLPRLWACIAASFAITLSVWRVVSEYSSVNLFSPIVDVAVIVFDLIALLLVIFKSGLTGAARLVFNVVFVLLLTSCIGVKYYLEKQDNSTSRFIFTSRCTDFNGTRIDLKTNGAYLITDWCLGADYYRGKYVLLDSLIVLSGSMPGYFSDQLTIKKDSTAPALFSARFADTSNTTRESDFVLTGGKIH